MDATVYGYYYNWPAAMHSAASSEAVPSGVQGVCPNGWHLPSDAEWTILTDYVSSQAEYMCDGNSDNIAKALAFTEGWNTSTSSCSPGSDPSTNNTLGFSAVPAGGCVGSWFHDAGNYANFWSSSQSESYSAWLRNLHYDNAGMYRNYDLKNYGRSVRCLRD